MGAHAQGPPPPGAGDCPHTPGGVAGLRPRGRVLSPRRVLVTGASSGIGRACADLLAERGFRVFAASRSAAASAPSGGGGASPVEPIVLDVRDERSVARAMDTVVSRAGGLDAVVCNAGVGLFGSVEAVSLDRARALWDTNVEGVLRTLRAGLPHLRASGGGRVVIVGSLAGRAPIPFMAHYSAGKAALEALALALRNELEGTEVGVSLVEPGDTRTAFNDRAEWVEAEPAAYRLRAERCRQVVLSSLPRAPGPEGVARVVLRALLARHPRARYTVGPDSWLVPLGRRLFPDWLTLRLIRRHFGV